MARRISTCWMRTGAGGLRRWTRSSGPWSWRRRCRVRTCVLHLGVRGDRWSEHALEHSLTAVEHLKAFATPLGVRLLLENLPNEIATAEHLETILRIGHFDSCGICLDTGHAHLSEAGLMATLELLRPRIAELHLHDNDGTSDTHLWPASGAERPAWSASGHDRLGGGVRGLRRRCRRRRWGFWKLCPRRRRRSRWVRWRVRFGRMRGGWGKSL